MDAQVAIAQPGATGAEVATAQLAGAVRQPSAMELAADPEDLKLIRNMYGSRAQAAFNSCC